MVQFWSIIAYRKLAIIIATVGTFRDTQHNLQLTQSSISLKRKRKRMEEEGRGEREGWGEEEEL